MNKKRITTTQASEVLKTLEWLWEAYEGYASEHCQNTTPQENERFARSKTILDLFITKKGKPRRACSMEQRLKAAKKYAEQFGIQQTCAAAPVQYEGTTHDGKKFFFWARYETVLFGVGSTKAHAIDDAETYRRVFRLDADPFEASWLDPEAALFILSMFLEAYRQEAVDQNKSEMRQVIEGLQLLESFEDQEAFSVTGHSDCVEVQVRGTSTSIEAHRKLVALGWKSLPADEDRDEAWLWE